MKRIPLTRGLFTTVDDEDYEWLMQWKWHAFYLPDGRMYAARDVMRDDGSIETLFMHEVIYFRMMSERPNA